MQLDNGGNLDSTQEVEWVKVKDKYISKKNIAGEMMYLVCLPDTYCNQKLPEEMMGFYLLVGINVIDKLLNVSSYQELKELFYDLDDKVNLQLQEFLKVN